MRLAFRFMSKHVLLEKHEKSVKHDDVMERMHDEGPRVLAAHAKVEHDSCVGFSLFGFYHDFG